jgi:HK97 family phage major capsid protein
MTLKEKLKAAQLKLKGLEYKINAGDAEAIKTAGELTTEIEQLQEQIKAAEKAQALLAQIGKKEGEADDGAQEKQARTLGDHFVNAVKKAGAHAKRFSVAASEFKAATDTQTSPTGISQYATDLDHNVVTAPRTALVIRDLFGAETISGNSLTYLIEGAVEGAPAVTAEGAEKPQMHFADPTPETVSLAKIACRIKESDEYISDYPFLASAINGRLLYQLGLVEQNKLVTDLTGTSGIQTDSSTWGAATKAEELADLVFTAMMDVQEASGFAADAIVMAPATWQTLRLGKDAEARYYGGGYFADGQGKQLWGLPVVVTTAVTASQIIVGAFKACGSVVQKGGVSVEATNSNEDDFVKNLMTIRAEERLALAVRRPAGFKLITKTA